MVEMGIVRTMDDHSAGFEGPAAIESGLAITARHHHRNIAVAMPMARDAGPGIELFAAELGRMEIRGCRHAARLVKSADGRQPKGRAAATPACCAAPQSLSL